MIDSHAHLFFDAFDADRAEVISRAREAGVKAIVNVGTDLETSEAAIDLSRRHQGLFAAVGLHPTSGIQDLDASMHRLEALAREHPRHVVAVGETGLDYYWKDIAPDAQKTRLLLHLALARRLGLPAIFHCRDALGDLISTLESERGLPPGVFHCFSGGRSEAERVLALGFHVSFAGNVTYPKAAVLQDVARNVPPDRLLLETDCPFLPPQPRRGKRNEPAFARHTLEFLARLQGLPPGELERITDESAVRLFSLEMPPASAGG